MDVMESLEIWWELNTPIFSFSRQLQISSCFEPVHSDALYHAGLVSEQDRLTSRETTAGRSHSI